MSGDTRTDYSREELIEICERAVVPHEHWHDRDPHAAQVDVGEARVLLKAGCEFHVCQGPDSPITTSNTIWLLFDVKNFHWFEDGGCLGKELVYLPTPARLDRVDGKDWY